VRERLVHTLFFLSGVSGLVYQVVWVRLFGNLFGNTVHSAATVSGVFLCGLGLGGWLTGRWIDRRWRGDPRRPLRTYAGFELGIAAMGLGLALALPLVEPLSAAISSYRSGPGGWQEPDLLSHVLRQAVAVALLAPITLPMGGTLVLLLRHLVARDVSQAGWRVGTLYGINTAGAACGAFLTDFALIPRLGVFGTQALAAGLNALAGLGALALARSASERAASAATAPAPAPGPVDPAARARLAWTAAALFASGLAAMGLQIVWFRYLTGVLGAYRSVFSLLLGSILVGLWLGAFAGGLAVRRPERAGRLYVGVQSLAVVATLALLALFGELAPGQVSDEVAARWALASAPGRRALELWLDLGPILALVGAPALLMGFAYPVANAHVQRLRSAVGGRAGALYLANTLGNLAGSLLAGFALLPLCGIQNSVGILAGFGALAVVAMQRSLGPGDAAARRVFAVALPLLALAVTGWSLLPRDLLLAPSVPRDFAPHQRVLATREGLHETVAVIEVPGVERRLFTNGHSMSSTHAFAQRYMRLFAHLPLLGMDDPRRVLVICFGVGNTLHAASLHPSVERLEAVDLSRNVLGHAPWFAATNGAVLEDPRTRVFVNDGRQHLRMQAPGSYDLVTLEPPPIATAGVASLYSREFYELARSRLRRGGALTQWLPAYQVDAPEALSIVRAFADAFPDAVLVSGYHSELILMGTREGAAELDPAALRRRLRDRPAVKRDLGRIDVETLTALVGTFVADAATLREASAGAAPVTDDRPLIEYGVHSRLFENRLPEALFAPERVAAWCPGCFRDGRPVRGLEHLPGHLAALAEWYASEAFRVHRSRESRGHVHRAAIPRDPRAVAAVRASRYLRRFVPLPEAVASAGGAP